MKYNLKPNDCVVALFVVLTLIVMTVVIGIWG